MFSRTRDEWIDLLIDDIEHILKVYGPLYMWSINKLIYDRFPGIHNKLGLNTDKITRYVILDGRDRILKKKGKKGLNIYYLPGQDVDFHLKQPHDKYRKRKIFENQFEYPPNNYGEVLKDAASDV